MSLSDFEEDIDLSVRGDNNQKTSRPITPEENPKESSANHLPVDEEPARENAPADEEVEEPARENAPADEEVEEPVEETAPADEEVEEPARENAPADEEVEEPAGENAPADEEVEETEPVEETAPADEERNDLSKSPSVASSSPINDDDSPHNDVPINNRDESKDDDMYAEDFNASSRAATPPPTQENERQSATPPPQAPPLSSASPSNPRHKKFAADDAGEAKRSSTFADDDESDDSSSISSLDSEKNAERKQQKQEEKKKKEKRKSVAKERAIRASRTVRVRGGIGTNGNTKDHRPGHIRVVSYLRDLSDFEKAHYKEECGLESGVGAVPIRMRRGVGVQDLGVGAATTATDGNQTGITRVALVEQGEFAHYRFDDCLWGCSSLTEETAQPSVPDATSLFDNVAAPLVTKLLQTGTPEDDPQSVVNASILCVGAESSGKGTVLFGGINPQPLNADFEAMRQHQQRLGILGGKVKITNPNEVGAPQGISYVEKNRRIRAAKEAAAGGEAAKKAPPKKSAAQKGGPKDPRPSTFEDIPASGGGVAADDGLVVRTLDALLKGCAGTERDVFVSFLRLDGTRDRLYNLIAPASDSQEAPTEASSSLGKSNEEYSDDDAHVATPTSSGPAAPSRKKSDMNALQTLALTLQSQVQCRPITVPVHKSDPTLGNITTYSLRGIKPIKLSSVTQARRLLFAARQRCQINIPQSADHKVVNEFQELGGLSDPSTTSIVSVIYLIPRTNDVGAPPLQKLIIAGLSTSNSSHISSSMGQTQLAVGNSLADAVRFGRRGFPEAGYKDITHFRDSTLSRALKECIFGPQAAVTVLGCLAPTTRYALPTHNTIRFLDRIKTIDIPEEALDGAVLEADTRIAEEAGSKPPVQPSPPLTHFRILGTIGNGQGAAGASAEFDAVVNTRADEKRNNRGMGGYGLNGEGTAAAGGEANNQENDEDGKKRSGFRLPGEKRDGPLWKDKYKGPLQLDHKAPTEAVGFVFNNHGQYNSNGGGAQQQVQPQAARKFLYDARKAQKDENDKRHELMQNEREAFVSLARKDMKGRLTYFRANPKVSRANPTTFAEYEKLEARRKAQKQAQIALYEERKRGGGKGGRDVSPSSIHNDPKGYADDFEGQAKEKDDNDSEGGGGDSDDENDFETSVKPHPAAKSKARVAVEAAAGGPHPHAKYGFFKGDNRNAPVPSNATYALEQGEKDRNKIKKPRPFALPAGMKRKQPPKPVVEEEPPAPPAKKVITPRQPVKRPAPPAGSKSNPTGASPRPTAKSKQPMPPAPSKGPANPRDTTPPATETSRASSSSSSVSKASSSRRSASSSSLPSKSIDSRRDSKPAPRKESVAASSVKDRDEAEDLDEDEEPDQSDDEDNKQTTNGVVAEEQPAEEEEAPLPEYIIPLSDLHFPNSTEGKRVVDFFGHRAHLSNFRLEGDVLPDGRRASYIEDKVARQEVGAASIRLYNPELFDDREEARNNRAVIYRDMIRANGKDVPPSSDSPSKAPVVMFAGVMRGIHLEAYRIYKELEDAEQGRKKPLFTKRIRPSETSLEVPLLVSCLSGGDEQAAFAPGLLQSNCSHPKLVAFVSGVFGESCSLLSTARKAYQYVLRGDDPPNPAAPGDKELKWSQFRRFCSFIGAYYEILTEVCGYMREVATALNGGTPLRPLTEADIDVCLDQLTSSSKTIPVGTALSFLNEAVTDEVTARLIAYSYQYLQVSECAFKYYYDGGADDASATGIYNKHHARNIAVIKPGLDVFEKWCEDHWALDHSQIKTRLTAQGKTVPEETIEDENGNTVTRLIVHNGVISNPFYLTEWLVRKVINRLEFQEEGQVTDEVEAAWISRANDVTNVTDDDDVEQEVEEFEEYEEEEEEEEEN